MHSRHHVEDALSQFRAVPNEIHFSDLEKQVLERWQAEGTFARSVKAREGCKEYVFYDGPPFATGLPHYGHILTSYIKDVIPRYFTMRGFHVPRRWGWDCHGLPVEFEVEKELGLRSRSEILAYGIEQFNEKCRGMVLRYAAEWQQVIERLGRWVDFDDQYRTMDADFIESVVWAFQELWRKDLIYEGNKVVPYCTRCQTPLSNFEARQDDAFRSRTDPAITVRFQRSDDPSQFFLAWTTTPWTLPANIALAVGPDFEYSQLEGNGEKIWLACAAASRFTTELAGYREIGRARGSDLVGTSYLPLFPSSDGTTNAFRVIPAEFVTTDDGTGIVHIAPSFGEDDAAVAARYDMNGPGHVRDDGTFDATVPELEGQHVFAANDGIIRRLREQGRLFKREQYVHNYPHCWRCDSPLIYRAIPSWFVKVTAVKEAMIAANQRIRWVPEHIRDGRFANWLENARDWAISRNRFWGTPIPVWRCADCPAMRVFGSRAEIEAWSGAPLTDWHRPWIDRVTGPCACGGTMSRVPQVLDCWFESGSMPYAQVHYPFEHKEMFERTFPADFIVEYVAQTRGWFYTLVVLAAAIFDDRPFKSVLCHGVILAEDGRKMSKHLKNYPDPMKLIDEHGSDALRMALLSSAVVRGADIRFSADHARESVRRVFLPLWNCLHFFTSFAEIDSFRPDSEFHPTTPLDRYLLSEVEVLRRTLEQNVEAYDLAACYEAIEEFAVTLSTWYVRLSRRRFWVSGMPDDKRMAFNVLYATLSTLARLLAPFLPFLAEGIHGALGGRESVHLSDWPAEQTAWSDSEITAEMREVRRIVRLVRGVREAHHISLRQPLRAVHVAHAADTTIKRYVALFLEELNVKKIERLESLEGHAAPVLKLNFARLGRRLREDMRKVTAAAQSGQYELLDDGLRVRLAGHEFEQPDFELHYAPLSADTGVAVDGRVVVILDLKIDSELLAEKQIRDINRALQDLRKEIGLSYTDRVVAGLSGPGPVVSAIEPHFPWLAEQVLAQRIELALPGEGDPKAQVSVGSETMTVWLRTIAPAS